MNPKNLRKIRFFRARTATPNNPKLRHEIKEGTNQNIASASRNHGQRATDKRNNHQKFGFTEKQTSEMAGTSPDVWRLKEKLELGTSR